MSNREILYKRAEKTISLSGGSGNEQTAGTGPGLNAKKSSQSEGEINMSRTADELMTHHIDSMMSMKKDWNLDEALSDYSEELMENRQIKKGHIVCLYGNAAGRRI